MRSTAGTPAARRWCTVCLVLAAYRSARAPVGCLKQFVTILTSFTVSLSSGGRRLSYLPELTVRGEGHCHSARIQRHRLGRGEFRRALRTIRNSVVTKARKSVSLREAVLVSLGLPVLSSSLGGGCRSPTVLPLLDFPTWQDYTTVVRISEVNSNSSSASSEKGSTSDFAEQMNLSEALSPTPPSHQPTVRRLLPENLYSGPRRYRQR